MTTLRDVFLQHVPAELRSSCEAFAALDERLAALLHIAGRAHAESFVAWVAERFEEGRSVEETFDKLRSEDLHLAWQAAHGVDAAIREIRSRCESSLRGAIARAGPTDLIDETMQRVLVKLFVAPAGRAPTIAKYTGRGSLEAWIAVVGTREARNALRDEPSRRHVREDDAARLLDGIVDANDDPELEHLKTTYRTQFKQAVQKALTKLPPKHRNLLRHEHLDGLDPDQMAALYGVHRATLYRWREQSRAVLLKETRTIIEREMALSRGEFESMMRLIQSQLDVSLLRVLDEDE